MITLLSIRSITPTSFILEEISVPSEQLKERPSSWKQWVEARAPGHTSWSAIEIERKTGEILECYSFSHASWIPLSSRESLIATLLKVPLHPIPDTKRRKIGPPPQSGEIDTRKRWEPSTSFEGQKEERIG